MWKVRQHQVLAGIWDNWNPQTMLAGGLHFTASLGNHWTVSANIKTHKRVEPSNCTHRDTPDRAAHLRAPKVCIEWSHLRVPSWRRHQCPWTAECSMFKWTVVQLHSTVLSLRKMSELFIYKTTQKNPTNIILSERNRHKRKYTTWFSFQKMQS